MIYKYVPQLWEGGGSKKGFIFGSWSLLEKIHVVIFLGQIFYENCNLICDFLVHCWLYVEKLCFGWFQYPYEDFTLALLTFTV